MTNFHINNIRIQNYKKYSNLELSFSNRVNLIIGENGTGKTSLLDALATLLGGYIQAFQNIGAGDRHSIAKKDIKVEIEDIDNNIVLKYKIPVVISGHLDINNQNIFIERVRRQEKNDTKTHLLKTINQDLIHTVSNIEKKLDNTILPIISYHGTGRLWEQEYKRTSKMEKLTRFDGYKDSLKDYLKNSSQEMINQIARSHTHFISSWLEIFKDYPEVKRVLLQSVHGTNFECYDENFNAVRSLER